MEGKRRNPISFTGIADQDIEPNTVAIGIHLPTKRVNEFIRLLRNRELKIVIGDNYNNIVSLTVDTFMVIPESLEPYL